MSSVTDRRKASLASFVEETNFTVDQVAGLIQHFFEVASIGEDDGMIDKAEFYSVLGVEGSAFFDRMFECFDEDGSGTIDIREFIQGLSVFCKNASKEEKIKWCFRIWDMDGDGHIQKEELKRMFMASLQGELSGIPERVIDDLVSASFAEADTNGDGLIDFEEFTHMCEKHPTILEAMTLDVGEQK